MENDKIKALNLACGIYPNNRNWSLHCSGDGDYFLHIFGNLWSEPKEFSTGFHDTLDVAFDVAIEWATKNPLSKPVQVFPSNSTALPTSESL